MLDKYPGINITINKHHNSISEKPDHVHSYNELYFLRDGNARHFIDNEIINNAKGELTFVRNGLIHKTLYEPGTSSERLLICFYDDFVGEDYRNILIEFGMQKFIEIPPLRKLEIENLMNRLYNEFCAKDEGYILMCKNMLRELLLLLYRQKKKTQKTNLSDNEIIIQNAAKYIAENYQEDLTLEGLAEMFAMSSGHFSKTFKTHTGFGVKEYIITIRIEKAEQLLKTQNNSITATASMCGFNDSNYFASVFKKRVGITPHKYSALYKKS